MQSIQKLIRPEFFSCYRVYWHTTSIKDKARARAPAFIFKTCFLNFVLSLYPLCLLHFCPAEAAAFIICEICGKHRTAGNIVLKMTQHYFLIQRGILFL